MKNTIRIILFIFFSVIAATNLNAWGSKSIEKPTIEDTKNITSEIINKIWKSFYKMLKLKIAFMRVYEIFDFFIKNCRKSF